MLVVQSELNGLNSAVHQPEVAASSRVRNEVTSRPIVGIVHSSARIAIVTIENGLRGRPSFISERLIGRPPRRWKCLIWYQMSGMTAMSRTTTMAVACPASLAANSLLKKRFAMTLVP